MLERLDYKPIREIVDESEMQSAPIIPHHPEWSDVPDDVKKIIASMLFKDSVIKKSPVAESTIDEEKLLTQKSNLDIRYQYNKQYYTAPETTNIDIHGSPTNFRYARMPWQKIYGSTSCIRKMISAIEDIVNGDEEGANCVECCVAGCLCGALIIPISASIAVCPLVATASAGGLFGDRVIRSRANKKSKEEFISERQLHSAIIGPQAQYM